MEEKVCSESDRVYTVNSCSDTSTECTSVTITGTDNNLSDNEAPYTSYSTDKSDIDNVIVQESGEKSDKDQHTAKLGKVCRICGEMTVIYEGPKKGIPKEEVAKHVKKIWNVDLTDESPEVYPVNVCISCERRIKRLYLKINKRKKCELYREKPAEFIEHSDKDCHVCQLKEEVETLSTCSPTVALIEQESSKQTGSVHDNEKKRVSPSLALYEPRRNSARKRCLEKQETTFVSVSSQTGSFHGFTNVTGLEEHDYIQDECSDVPKKQGGRMPYHKLALSSVTTKYIRQERLKPLIALVDKYCEVQKEDKTEVLFFLLVQTLRETGDRTRGGLVADIWCGRDSSSISLTQEECLAKRILLKQTKDQYRKEYSYYKEKLNKCLLKPPSLLDRLEKTYFPENLEYWVTEGDGDHIIHQHSRSLEPSIISIPQSNGCGQGEEARRGILGVRWHYLDALTKTLEELWGTLEREVEEDMYLQADVADYLEERRDATAYTEKTDPSGRAIQSKVVTYMFRVIALNMVIKDKVTSVYKVDPSVTLYRPLMKALLGEGGTLQPSLSAIETERAFILDKLVHIRLLNAAILKVIISFTSPVVEAHKDYRNPSGLNLWSLRKMPTILNRYGSVCLDMKRSWLASSPRLISISTGVSAKPKCSRCGHQGHNVRKCSVKCESGEKTGPLRKRKRKYRSVPTSSHQSLSLPTQVSRDVKTETCGKSATPPEASLPPLTTTCLTSALPMASGSGASGSGNSGKEVLWTCPGLTSVSSYPGTSPAASCPIFTPSVSFPSISSGTSCLTVSSTASYPGMSSSVASCSSFPSNVSCPSFTTGGICRSFSSSSSSSTFTSATSVPSCTSGFMCPISVSSSTSYPSFSTTVSCPTCTSVTSCSNSTSVTSSFASTSSSFTSSGCSQMISGSNDDQFGSGLSQTTSSPLYVWTYTLVQPTSATTQLANTQLCHSATSQPCHPALPSTMQPYQPLMSSTTQPYQAAMPVTTQPYQPGIPVTAQPYQPALMSVTQSCQSTNIRPYQPVIPPTTQPCQTAILPTTQPHQPATQPHTSSVTLSYQPHSSTTHSHLSTKRQQSTLACQMPNIQSMLQQQHSIPTLQPPLHQQHTSTPPLQHSLAILQTPTSTSQTCTNQKKTPPPLQQQSLSNLQTPIATSHVSVSASEKLSISATSQSPVAAIKTHLSTSQAVILASPTRSSQQHTQSPQ
ncbi:hypothetical protein Pmani_007375 [Petrolisthes manimaculis]|uniref:V(D)J recombination-activating protein 1 n=1 Tax=Petrolisthes manimaculis TaxID=1843537 RepID=A0AAE1Q7W9_9EUCA|nr:hypothetical protein Pmani_007375 [Petrolisthes manimaculis]